MLRLSATTHVAGAIGLAAGSSLALLASYDSASTDHEYLPAPWGALLFVLILIACLGYGYGRGRLRAMWTGAWVSVLAVIMLEVAAVALNAGEVNAIDPNDPVISPVAGLIVLPLLLGLIAAGVGLRRWHGR